MTAHIIVISNQKGGTGKTALTFEIGTILSKTDTVLFVDLDAQRDLSRMLTDKKTQTSTLELLKGSVPAEKAIVNINSHVSLIPATDDLLMADTELLKMRGQVAGRLSKVLEPIKNDYDYILIDTPPKLGTLMTNALQVADSVFIPTLAENNSIDGAENFYSTFTAVNKGRKSPARLEGFIVTRYSSRSTINRQLMEYIEKLAEQIHTAVYPVKETVKMREAHFYKKSVTDWEPNDIVSKQLVDIVNHLKGLSKDGANSKKVERKYKSQARDTVEILKLLVADEERLENFESYLSLHYKEWLDKYANTPDGVVNELKRFAGID